MTIIPDTLPELSMGEDPEIPCHALALANCGTLIRLGALDDAWATLDQLGADLQDADKCLDRERLGFASSWLQREAATKVAQNRAEAAAAESTKEASEARAARDSALAEAGAAAKHCGEAEASLKALQEEQATGADNYHSEKRTSRLARRMLRSVTPS